jgi:hypothetical protein
VRLAALVGRRRPTWATLCILKTTSSHLQRAWLIHVYGSGMRSDVVRTSDVFVPGRAPLYTYNPRSEFELEDRLREYIDDGGSVLALVGPTKTGKSVLLRRVLDEPVWVDGQGVQSVEALWQLVGSELGVSYSSEHGTERGTSTTATAKAKAFIIEGGGDVTAASGKTETRRAVAAPEVEVKKALMASGRILVIDDFHFIQTSVQQEIVRAVKPLVFDGLRTVFAAISHRRHDVPTVVEDMVGRVTPLEIALWTEAELQVIASKGFEKLNVSDPGGRISARLAGMSFGSPHMMQKLCREICREVNEVLETAPDTRELREPEDWDAFFRSQVEDASGRWFTRLLTGPRERTGRTIWSLEDGRKVDGYGLVLVAIGKTGPRLELSKDEIRHGVESAVSGKAPEANQVTRVLQNMSRIAARRLNEQPLTEEELDEEGDTFGGVQPVVEYIDDGPNSTLHIADPFFAYYMRWGVDRHLPAVGGHDPTLDLN